MLKNIRFAGRTVLTAYGEVKYDENGITKDLTPEQMKSFARFEGYELVEETEKPEKVEEEPKEEKPKKEKTKEDKTKYTKAELESKTVPQLDKLAKDKGIELSGTVKKEKVEELLKKL